MGLNNTSVGPRSGQACAHTTAGNWSYNRSCIAHLDILARSIFSSSAIFNVKQLWQLKATPQGSTKAKVVCEVERQLVQAHCFTCSSDRIRSCHTWQIHDRIPETKSSTFSYWLTYVITYISSLSSFCQVANMTFNYDPTNCQTSHDELITLPFSDFC